jgi:hypothetical protein
MQSHDQQIAMMTSRFLLTVNGGRSLANACRCSTRHREAARLGFTGVLLIWTWRWRPPGADFPCGADRAASARQGARRHSHSLRQRIDRIARLMTLEQGKPLAEARAKSSAPPRCAIGWSEKRNASWALIPARTANVTQMVVKEPVGIVAAFTP